MHAKLLQLFLTLCDPMDRKLLCPWDSPSKNTGVGCHAILQRIFPTQGLNPCPLCLPTLAGSLPLVTPGKPTDYTYPDDHLQKRRRIRRSLAEEVEDPTITCRRGGGSDNHLQKRRRSTPATQEKDPRGRKALGSLRGVAVRQEPSTERSGSLCAVGYAARVTANTHIEGRCPTRSSW